MPTAETANAVAATMRHQLATTAAASELLGANVTQPPQLKVVPRAAPPPPPLASGGRIALR
eukprot:5812544-Prymnesium_polylepis.1